MIEGRNIVCFASGWDYDPTSKHHLMRILEERNHVVWVNYHGSRRPSATAADLNAILRKLTQFAAGPRRASESITVITPAVVPLPGHSAAQRLNRLLLVRQVRSVLDRLPPRPVQVWSFAPDVGHLAGQFGEELFLYYCVDAFGEFAGYDRPAIQRAELLTLRAADLVITTSARLYESKRGFNPRTELVFHGVDWEHFQRDDAAGEPPAELRDVRGPVLGFFGLIEHWIDVEMLAVVARHRRDWTIAMIGDVRTDVAALRECANVRLLGRRPYAELPRYARWFDVGMIPFRLNELTRAANPIKLREYLAAGLPVASTPLPEVLRYRPLIEVGNGPEGYAAACERALRGNDESSRLRRREAMRREGWREKVADISGMIEGVLAGRRSHSDATT